MNKTRIGCLVVGVCLLFSLHVTPTHASMLPLSQYTLLEEIITSLRNVLQALTISSAPLTSSSTQCVDLKRTLAFGSTGGDVAALQNFLKELGYLNRSTLNGFYGPATSAAVGKLQLDRGILSAASDPGYGITGPKTREALACPKVTTPVTPTDGGVSTTTAPITPTTTPTVPVNPNPTNVDTTDNEELQPRVTSLLRQPDIKDIDDYFYVQGRPAEKGNFYLVQWQKNPFTTNGQNIPVGWKVGDKTGFYPKNATSSQLGMRNIFGSTAVQAEGRTIGIYLNSKDLIYGSPGFKLGLFPATHFTTEPPLYPFTDKKNEIRGSISLQVPTAKSEDTRTNNAFATHFIVFLDPVRKVEISFGVNLFFHNRRSLNSGSIGFDEPTRSIMISSPLGGGTRVTPLAGSSLRQTQPWKGYKKFAFSISGAQFEEGLKEAAAVYPEKGISVDPKDYYIKSSHLNSELHYESGTPELGLSLRNFRVDLVEYK